jgi:hypothetical protein
MKFLDDNGIHYDSVNENHPSMGFWLQSRKIFADVYIDDRNLGGVHDWIDVPLMLREHHGFEFKSIVWDALTATMGGGATTYTVRQ